METNEKGKINMDRFKFSKPFYLVVAGLVSLAIIASYFIFAAAPGQPEESNSLAEIKLPKESNGEEAITLLGPNISLVAKENGKSVAEIAKTLRNDKTLHVDTTGKLFFKEEAPSPSEVPELLAAESNPTTIPTADAFKLHSKTGSKRVIYLDFDGHDLSKTVWGSQYQVAPPWDIDGNPATYNDAERRIIIEVWRRVAEDYAPFDVDVTTEYPGEEAMNRDSSSDELYGTRALISPLSSSYAGIAYVGVFDFIGTADRPADYYKPALIFPQNLANGAKNIAECVSHEVGHNLGLLHDGISGGSSYYSGQGTGETGWAPIMGTAYSRNLSQWSKGEYANASNQEDDYLTISANGVYVRADDHSNSPTNSKNIVASSSINATGSIERPGDVDVLNFSTSGGQANLALSPALVGANVDLLLQLRDASGKVITENNPIDKIGATVSATLSSGTYYIYIQGVGAGDPLTTGYTNYGSLGAWTLTGSITTSGDSTAPSVLIVEPKNSTTTTKTYVTGTVDVRISATDNIGVNKVELYIGTSAQPNLTELKDDGYYHYSWDTTSLSANNQYDLRAVATDVSGLTSSNTVRVYKASELDTTAPTAPTNLTVKASAYNKVDLSWSASSDNVGVAGYYVLRSSSGSSLTTIAQVSGATLSYADASAQANTSYSYQVKAFDAAGNISAASNTATVTTPSEPDTAAPTAPTNLSGTAVSASQINLSWTASTDNVGVSGYDVYRDGAKIASVSTTSFGDTGLSGGTAYKYYVVAKDTAGNTSPASTTISTSTLAAVVTTGNLQGTVTESTGAAISGAKVSFAIGRKKYSATTTTSGYYAFGSLPAGTYSVSYSKKGYSTAKANVTILSGQTITKDVSLNKR